MKPSRWIDVHTHTHTHTHAHTHTHTQEHQRHEETEEKKRRKERVVESTQFNILFHLPKNTIQLPIFFIFLVYINHLRKNFNKSIWKIFLHRMNSHNRVSKYLNFMYFMSLTKQSKLRFITIGVVSNCSTRNGFATSDINELSCKVYLKQIHFLLRRKWNHKDKK